MWLNFVEGNQNPPQSTPTDPTQPNQFYNLKPKCKELYDIQMASTKPYPTPFCSSTSSLNKSSECSPIPKGKGKVCTGKQSYSICKSGQQPYGNTCTDPYI